MNTARHRGVRSLKVKEIRLRGNAFYQLNITIISNNYKATPTSYLFLWSSTKAVNLKDIKHQLTGLS